MLYSLSRLKGQAERLLRGERHRPRVSTAAAAADDLGVEVVDEQRPVDVAGQARAAGECRGDQAGVVVTPEAGQLEHLVHAVRVPESRDRHNPAPVKPPTRGAPPGPRAGRRPRPGGPPGASRRAAPAPDPAPGAARGRIDGWSPRGAGA